MIKMLRWKKEDFKGCAELTHAGGKGGGRGGEGGRRGRRRGGGGEVEGIGIGRGRGRIKGQELLDDLMRFFQI